MAAAVSETRFISPDAGALATATADQIVSILADAIRERGHATLALSGGTTPFLYLPLLSSEPRKSALAWDRLAIFWADERCVPPDHPDSNYGLALDLLLSQVPVPAAHLHRIHGELPPDIAAERYRNELADYFGGLPRFDLILLGIGSDGHTASLFPVSTALDADTHACAVQPPNSATWRITLTLPVLNNARTVIFCVSGSGKAAIMKELMDTELRRNYPAGRVVLKDGNLIWLLDEAAIGS